MRVTASVTMSRDGGQRLTTASDAAALHQRLAVSLRR